MSELIGGSADGVVILHLTFVPEPSTGALCALGAIVLGGCSFAGDGLWPDTADQSAAQTPEAETAAAPSLGEIYEGADVLAVDWIRQAREPVPMDRC